MKVLWVSDYGIKLNSGGAQRSNSLIIEEGKKRGHSIIEFNVNSDDKLLHPEYDLLVSSNLEALCRKPRMVEWLSTFPNHVRVEHDSNRYLPAEDRRLLFSSCKKSFFLSSFHLQQFVSSYGDYFTNAEIIPDPIDPITFCDRGLERENKTLYVGYMHPYKGTSAFFSHVIENPEDSFVVAGWSNISQFVQTCEMIPNIEFLGKIDFTEMPILYNKYKYLFYKPTFYEPYCRSVAEAIFCGMEVIGNDLIGCLHHMKEAGKDEMVSQCSRAPESFWESVECL
tara:strand:- start:6143 stop:6988 length:846 start_codon:yes stop_codon:yes gene_type:complete